MGGKYDYRVSSVVKTKILTILGLISIIRKVGVKHPPEE